MAVVRGIPTWVTALAIVVGAIGAVILTLAVQRYKLIAKTIGFARERGLVITMPERFRKNREDKGD